MATRLILGENSLFHKSSWNSRDYFLLTEEIQTRPKPRIESLSDLIFGLALSIGAVSLLGNLNSITSSRILFNDIVTFGFSFLIIIGVWMRYTKLMSVLPLENRWTVSLNTALLFTVSLEPFLFNVMQLDVALSGEFSSQFYAADLGVMMAILGSFSLVLADEERKLIPKDLVREYRRQSVILFVAAALFFISTSDIFWVYGPNHLYWRFYLWIIPFVLSSVQRRTTGIIGEIRKHQQKKTASI
jgi:uncharacterized membrane protein